MKPSKAYAWELESGEICMWAEPDKHRLLERSRPSSEAVVVAVRIIKESDYRKMRKSLEGVK